MTPQRRILHVTSGLGLGGAETMLYRLIEHSQGREDMQHSIVSLTDNNSFDFHRLGVPVETIPLQQGPLRGLWMLRRGIARFDPAIVQSWMYHGNAAATLAAIASHRPVVWSIHHSLHDLHNEKRSTRWAIQAGRHLSRWSTTRRIVYVSEKSRQHHDAFGYEHDKAILIPNGFDCLRFAPDKAVGQFVRESLGLSSEHLVFGSFGRYHPVKDHASLIRAFAQVAAQLPHARLVLAGADVTNSNRPLTTLLDDLGVRHLTHLLGMREDMPQLYNSLDIYVLSSRSESFPNVLGEASACAVPSVSTDVGDSGRIVGNTGFVVPPGNTDALASALLDAGQRTPAERCVMGERARQRIVEHFSLPVVAEAYRRLYDELLDPAPPR